jgi:DNA-binding MarR family transcriptional regulator
MAKRPDYQLEDQIGFVLRRVTQRHLALFSAAIPQVTTTQWAVIARLSEIGPMSQNHLGREAAMDAATVKGVVDRLVREGLVETAPDPDDRRRLTVALTAAGRDLFQAQLAAAAGVSEATLSPLTPQERAAFMALLARLT